MFQKNIVCMKLKLALQRALVKAEMRPVNLELKKTVSSILFALILKQNEIKFLYPRKVIPRNSVSIMFIFDLNKYFFMS